MYTFADPITRFNLLAPCPRPWVSRCNQRRNTYRHNIFLAMLPDLLAKRRRTGQILQRDLLNQYTSPRSMNWSIYDKSITFDDPMTQLSGKLQYRGMLLTIGLLVVRFLFMDGQAQFSLSECALTDDLEKIHTKFETSGTTKWGSRVRISGEDYFWFGKGSDLIVRHQSIWDQNPDEVIDAFRGRKS